MLLIGVGLLSSTKTSLYPSTPCWSSKQLEQLAHFGSRRRWGGGGSSCCCWPIRPDDSSQEDQVMHIAAHLYL